MIKKRINKILWHGNDLNPDGSAKAPSVSTSADGTDGLNNGEVYICNSDDDPALFIRTDKDKIVRIGGQGNDDIKDALDKKLDKSVWDSIFVIHKNDPQNPEKITSVQSLVGLWTDEFLSSKGLNPGSGGGSGEGGATALYQLNDIAKNASETGVLGAGPGKVLTYGTDGKWYAADAIGLDETALGEYLTDNNYAKKSDIPSLSGYATESWVLGKNYITSSALSDYATQSWVNSQGYATASSLKVVSDKLNDFLTGTDTDGIINKWKELEAFLAGQTQTSTLAELLAVKADIATTLSGYGITDAYTKSEINSKLSGYVTTTALNTALAKKVDVAFLGKVFGFIGEDNSEVAINDMEAVITSIKAKFGLWTDEYLSSKGLNPNAGGGSGEGATALYQLNDVAQNANGTGVLGAEAGKVLTYGSDGKWYAAKAGMDEDALSNYLKVNNYAQKSDIPSLDGYATITSVNSALDNKVDKISGMGLSQNNFTDALLQKLNGIAEGANKYILPVAKAAVLGGVMIGSTLNASEAGVLNLPEVMTAGTYAKVTTDIYGRVTSGSSLSAGDIPALGISKITGLQDALDKKVSKSDFATEFDKAMQRWFVRDTANKGLHPADYNSEAVGIYSDSYVSSKGVNTGTGGGTGGASSLGELNNVGSWADEIPTVDRIMVQRKGATHWESLNLSDIGLNESQLSNYLTTNNYAKKSDIPSLAGYATESWVLGKGYITSAALTGYATQSWVNAQLGSYATSSALQSVSDKLNDFLTGTDTDNVINKWKELEDFLTGFKETDTLADALSLKADKTISISTGTGLSGGGDLTADRTISLNAATTTTLGGIKVGTRLSIDANGVLSATYTYTLPTASATVLGGVKVGTTLAISSGVLNLKAVGTAGTYFKVTTDAYGRVTSGSNPTTLSGFGITDGFNTVAYSGSGNAITSATFSGHTLTLVKGTTFLTKATFDDLFEKVNIGTTSAPVYAIKAKYGLYTDQFLSSKGMNTGSGGGSGSDYDRLDAWADYDASKAGWVLSAGLGNDLNTRMTSLEGGAAVTVTPSGTGSVVTGVTKSGTVITVTKGNLAFGSLTGKPTTLSGYGITDAVTLTTPQEISGQKTFSNSIRLSNKDIQRVNAATGTNATGSWWRTANYATTIAGVGCLTIDNANPRLFMGWSEAPWELANSLTVSSTSLTYKNNAILHAGNYNTYAPTKTGTGASGTWGISITGNAATATKLGTATVGSTSKGIYLNAGVPTAMSATVGDSTIPVYMNAGTITASTWGFTGTTGNRVRKSGYVYSATASLSSYWGKLASMTFNGTTERDITLYVHSGAYGYYGIVAIRTRWESATTFYVSCKIISGNLLADRFRLYYDASKSTGNVELWANVATQWGTLNAYVLSSTDRTSIENGNITMSTNVFSTAQTLPTTPYVSPTYITLYNNASTATQLQTSRTINGTNFNGTANITTANWGTARNIGIVNSDGTGTAVVTSVNGSANVNLKLPATIKATITGNASSATKLATARTITVGGQALTFDGTANIAFTRNTMGVAYGRETSYNVTTTADGWYRIAVSNKSIVNCNGIFTIVAAASGYHTVATINASISYGRNPSITQLGCSHYSNIQIKAVRLVWHDSYTDNYAYLEIQTAAAISTNIEVKIVGGAGWNIYTSATAGSIPSGYSSKSLTLVSNSIRATTFVGALTGNAGSATKLQTARTIFGKSFDGSANVAGQAFVYGTYTTNASVRYSMGALQIRENGQVGSAQTDDGYAPAIGFHWQSKIAASLIMSSAGNFKFLKQNFTDYAPIYAGQITAQESYLRSVNNGNTVQIGSQNTTYAHFTSSKPFWFGNGMEINGYCYPYTNNSFTLGNASKRWSNVYATAGNFSSYIDIGSIRISYDSANNALKVAKADGTAAGLYAMGSISSLGLATGTGGGGGSDLDVYGSADLGKTFDDKDLTNTFNAFTTASIAKRVTSLEGGSALTVTTTGSGNAVTSVTKAGTAITVTKGATFLTSHQSLANYVTLNSAQTITAEKTWAVSQKFGNSIIRRINSTTDINASGTHWYTNNYAAIQFGIGVYTESNANPRAYIGWTATPWQASTNLTVSSTQLTYKANNILHAANYNNYAPSKTGTGASGTWGISITGNAATVGGFAASKFMQNFVSNSTDLNNMVTSGVYRTANTNANLPSGTYYYSQVLVLRGGGDTIGQLAMSYSQSGRMAVRSGNPTQVGGSGTWGAWNTVAFTTDNVASATKLQTARTIWGQSFNGTANVSGAISGATTITASSTIQGTQLKSTIATGTAPLTVVSTTKVANLNADLLEGYHGSTTQAANTVVLRNSSGYIYANYINSNTPVNENASIGQIITTNSSDNSFFRKSSIGQLRNALTNTRTTLDLTALDANKWYPCSMVLSSRYLTEIRIWVSLEGDKPTWATHTQGFTLNLAWQASGDGWGGGETQRKILNSYYSFAPSNPCGGIEQNNYASVEIVYLRGGAKYYYAADNGGTFTINSSGYSWVSGDYKYTAPVLTSPKKDPALCYENASMLGVVDLYVGNILSAVNFSNRLSINGEGKIYPYSTSTRRAGMYGVYDSAKIGHIWSMGTAYQIADDGANFGSLYGFAYKHTTNTTGGTMASGHQAVWCENGTPRVAIGTNFWVANAATVGGTITAGGLIKSTASRCFEGVSATKAWSYISLSSGSTTWHMAVRDDLTNKTFQLRKSGADATSYCFDTANLYYATNNTASLGTSSYRWSNVYTQLLNVAGATTLSSTLNVTGVLTASSTLNVTGILNANNTTDATSATAAGAVFDGGVGIAKQLRVGGSVTLGNALIVPYTGSSWITLGTRTNIMQGAISQTEAQAHGLYRVKSYGGHTVTFGGLGNVVGFYGIYKATIDAGTNRTDWSTIWNTTTGKLTHNKAMEVYGVLDAASTVNANSTTDSTSTTTGSIVCDGGVGIAKQLRVGGVITGNGTINGLRLGISNTSNTTGYGLSLYAGAVTGMPTYGIAFAGTGTFGTHGGVTSDWATYLTMSDTTTRGWIFRRGTTNVASISGTGTATLSGGLSVASTSTFTGKTTHNGGLGATTGTFSSTLSVTGVATFSNATDATSTTAAGVKVTGGLGVAKQLRVGSTSTFTGKTTHNGGISTTTMTMSSTGDNVLLFTGAAERRIHFLGDREDHWARIQGLYAPVPNVGHNIQLNIQVGIGAIQLSSTNGTLFVVGQNEILASGVLHNTTGMYSDGYMSSKGLNDTSDMRLKNKVRDIFLPVKDIANAPAFEYTWKDGTPGAMVGSSAQYWEKVLPPSVKKNKDGYLSLFSGHTALVAAISVAREVETLEQRVARLEKENKEKDKTIEDLNQKYITLKNMYYGKIDSAC